MPGVLHIQRSHKHLQPAQSQAAGGRRLPGAVRSEVGDTIWCAALHSPSSVIATVLIQYAYVPAVLFSFREINEKAGRKVSGRQSQFPVVFRKIDSCMLWKRPDDPRHFTYTPSFSKWLRAKVDRARI